MTLAIQVSPELQRRLAEEAARRGQTVEELAREILEARVGEAPAPAAEASWLARLPRPDPDEVQAILRADGAKPVHHFEELLETASEPDEDEEFDVDDFLQERRRWQWEGAPVFPDALERKTPRRAR